LKSNVRQIIEIDTDINIVIIQKTETDNDFKKKSKKKSTPTSIKKIDIDPALIGVCSAPEKLI